MTQPRLRLAVLASGHGSNLQALIDAAAGGAIHAELAGVFSDRADAGALKRARAAGAPALALAPADYSSRLRFDEALFSHVDAVHPDVIVCAGYMRLISEREVTARLGRMINIHPSLLPAFKGLHTHRRALESGASVHGASVHFVAPELDGGPVIAQARVPICPGDDPDRLSRRVLQREHPLLIQTVRLLAQRRLVLQGHSVVLDGHRLDLPLQLTGDDRLHLPDAQDQE